MTRTALTATSLRVTLATVAAALALVVGAVPATAAAPKGQTGDDVVRVTQDVADDGTVGSDFRIPGVCNVFPWLC